jgi:hypothetical protein
MVTTAGERDLLTSDDQLEDWIGAERGRIPGVEAASGRLAEVRDLRETVRELLHARARGKRPPRARTPKDQRDQRLDAGPDHPDGGRPSRRRAGRPGPLRALRGDRRALCHRARGSARRRTPRLRGAKLRHAIPAGASPAGVVFAGVREPRPCRAPRGSARSPTEAFNDLVAQALRGFGPACGIGPGPGRRGAARSGARPRSSGG